MLDNILLSLPSHAATRLPLFLFFYLLLPAVSLTLTDTHPILIAPPPPGKIK